MKNRTTVCDKEYRLKSICSIMSYNIISYNTTGKFVGAVATIIAKTIIAICTDAAKAATMREWKGGIKIKLINYGLSHR